MDNRVYLEETALLDYNSFAIKELIKSKNWQLMDEKGKILAIYNYVRYDISFGYNVGDNISATRVLRDGYGQCNTKGILFMALLRAIGVSCRMHGFYVDNSMQKGMLKSFYYALSPKDILHSWVEVFYKDNWFNLEGFILDMGYISKLQEKFKDCNGSFYGYAVAVDDFKNPPIEWDENDTYIQKENITKDLGTFNNPDELFTKYTQKIGLVKNLAYKYLVRHLMNKNVRAIREL